MIEALNENLPHKIGKGNAHLSREAVLDLLGLHGVLEATYTQSADPASKDCAFRIASLWQVFWFTPARPCLL